MTNFFYSPSDWTITTSSTYFGTAWDTQIVQNLNKEDHKHNMSPFNSSINFFKEFIDSLIDNESLPNFNYQGSSDSGTPYLSYSTYRDYEWVLEIDGKFILCYSQGNTGASESVPIKVKLHDLSTHDGGQEVCIGYRSAQGIYVSIDLRYCKFVKLNEDTSLWETAPDEEGGPSASQVLLEYFDILEFFQNWKPPTLEDIVRQEWASRRQRETYRSVRQIKRIANDIEINERHLENLRRSLIKEKANLSEWGHLTLEAFMDAIEQYRGLLDAVSEEVYVEPDFISINIKAFEIQSILLGPFNIKYVLGSSRIMVTPLPGAQSSVAEYFHPHVNRDGSVCFGENDQIITTAMRNPFEALFLTVDFLKTGYYPENAYARLSSWRSSPSWYCSGCDEYHDDGQGCPNECGECGRNVNWEAHKFCEIHTECHEIDVRCASCVRDEEERKERKRKEAEERANKAAEGDDSEEGSTKSVGKKKSGKKKAGKKKAGKKKAGKKKASKKKASKKVAKRTSRRSVPARAA